jgi:leader peptidase (prepilin peptidase) / N-methyltransferase
MGIEPIFDREVWSRVPFHFWSLTFFVFGTIVGSFLNVVIHRLPLEQSVISPPSHCPHCKYSIPWFLNIPLLTWLWLRGKCKNCSAPISPRYFMVELLTGVAFLACWLVFGRVSTAVALIYCLFLAGLIAATFIDFEHFIIPDQITLGGIVVGVLCSFAFPALHQEQLISTSLKKSFIGAFVGAALVYAILRMGKLLFGRQQLDFSDETKIYFTESALVLPDKEVPYDDLFYRQSDAITLTAKFVELPDRCYRDVLVRLKPSELEIGEDKFNPETVPHLEAITSQISLPREAMGLGDVKFMAAIGAFLGWQATVFSLMVSSIIGSIVGLALILLRKQAWSSRLPYGPYIALAAAIWIFGGKKLAAMILRF